MFGLSKGWKPSLLSGLVTWLQADSVAGNDGDAIATWPNSAPTGSANDVAQATGGKKPLLKKAANGINNHNVLRFDGTDDFMRGTLDLGSTGCTMFFVARTGGALSAFGTVIGSGGPNGGGSPGDNPTTGIRWAMALGNDAAYGAGWVGDSTPELGPIHDLAINQTYIGSYRYDKVTWTVNGLNLHTEADTTFPSSTFQLHVGDECTISGAPLVPFNGDIAEILIFNRQLSDAEEYAVRHYLNQKYFANAAIPFGVKLWLDADTVAGNDGDAIATWANQSLHGATNDVAQGTGGNQPLLKKAANGINNHNVLRFDGTDDFMVGSFDAGSHAFEVFYVARTGASLSTYGVLFGSGGLQGVVGTNVTNGIGWGFSLGNSGDTYGAGWVGAAADKPLGDPLGLATDTVFYGNHAYEKTLWTNDGVNSDTEADTSFPSSSFKSYVGMWGEGAGGGSWPYRFKGDIAEIIVYSRQLSARERLAVKRYLYTKYFDGIPMDMQAWYDASVGVTQSGTVSQWDDQSGNGYHVTQATGGNRPTYNASGIYGKPSITFATGKSLTNLSTSVLAAGSPRTIISVCRPSSAVGGILFTSRGDPGLDSTWCVLTFLGKQYFWSDGSAENSVNTEVDYTNVPMLVEQRGKVGSPSVTVINGDTIAYDTSHNVTTETGSTGIAVGARLIAAAAGQEFIGDISEIIVYDRILTGAEFEQIRTYVRNKYGIVT